MLSYSGDLKKDGWIPVTALPQLECSVTDPDFKALLRAKMLHRRGEECTCLEKREWEWPAGRGWVVHDWLDYNPSRDENEVKTAQKAELRDPALRQAVRERDLGRCRYCGVKTSTANRSTVLQTLDHVDPLIAAGLDNLVIACKPCNAAKKKRTPEQALMKLLDVDDVRALHLAELGEPDLDSSLGSKRVPNGQADAPGRVGSGTGRVAVLGPPTTRRDSVTPNPYTRAGHGDPDPDPPPTPPPTVHERASPARAAPPSPRPTRPTAKQRKAGRRRR